MWESASADRWEHTSAVLAMLANCNRDPRKTPPFRPEQFNPHTPPKQETIKVGIDVLKVFCRN